MSYLKRVFLILLLIFIISGTGMIYSAPLQDHPQRIEGTWLYLWWHGSASIAKSDGTASNQLMFIPESYRETSGQKSESFFHFRADGTGLFFRRYITLTYKKGKEIITVVSRKPGGVWAENDELNDKAGFRWEIKGNQLTLRTIRVGDRFQNPGRYEFVFNTVPTRPASRELKSRMKLRDELIIYKLGQFLRLGGETEQNLLQRYQIP